MAKDVAYAFQGDKTSGNQPGRTWAKASGKNRPLVQTSEGYSIDFFTDNFDIKHVIVVDNAQSFDAILKKAHGVQAARANKNLYAHNGAKISKSNINTSIVVTLGMLAAWGADIIKQYKKIESKPTGVFKGVNQWTVGSVVKSAIYTKYWNGGGESGVGAYAEVTLERQGKILYVSHLHAASLDDPRRSIDPTLTGHKSGPMTEADAKRQARFNKQFDEFDYAGISRLFS